MVRFAQINISAVLAPTHGNMQGGSGTKQLPSQPITLSRLFKDIPVISKKIPEDREVTRLITDSRRVVPGSVFFAISGTRDDGNIYIEEAIDRGAVAIVSEKPVDVSHRAVIQVSNTRDALAAVAACFYNYPDKSINITGITGTNGKTTVSTLAQFIFQKCGQKTGLLGTVQYDLGKRTIPSFKTTPESVDVFALLDQMRAADCQNAVMEISSHGIDQKRVQGLNIKVAAFLNLTQDHIDYHKTLENYFQVKTRLFTGETGHTPELAIINTDDDYGKRLLTLLPSGVKTISFGLNQQADFRAESIRLDATGTHFILVHNGKSYQVNTLLPGNYNVSNVLAAIAIAYGQGFHLEAIIRAVAEFKGVAGRMERVEAGQPFSVFIDYAHTDDALRNALKMLRQITAGRLLVVFGCGGNRDRQKRPLMARAVLDLADNVWITADNPRSEPLEQIFTDIKTGIKTGENPVFISDRRHAIGLALDEAKPGDTLLIAGKGHETFQEFADTVIPFDDRQVAQELIQIKRLKRT